MQSLWQADTLSMQKESWQDSIWQSLVFEGEFSFSTHTYIREKIEGNPLTEGLEGAEKDEGPRYSKENLYASPDFRALVALQYIVDFSKKVGFESKLEPVLSYPLGVNVVTLRELLQSYEVLKDGVIRKSDKTGERLLLIEKLKMLRAM